MIAEVFWTKGKFPGRIALIPRPRGGEWLEDEINALATAGLDVIVSMLDAEETQNFNLGREAEFCEKNEIEFIAFPVADRGVPNLDQTFWQLTERLKKFLSEGENVGIHCRQSIGRAPLLAAVLMSLFGVNPTEAFQELSFVRGVQVPETREQKVWMEKFAEELLTV